MSDDVVTALQYWQVYESENNADLVRSLGEAIDEIQKLRSKLHAATTERDFAKALLAKAMRDEPA